MMGERTNDDEDGFKKEEKKKRRKEEKRKVHQSQKPHPSNPYITQSTLPLAVISLPSFPPPDQQFTHTCGDESNLSNLAGKETQRKRKGRTNERKTNQTKSESAPDQATHSPW